VTAPDARDELRKVLNEALATDWGAAEGKTLREGVLDALVPAVTAWAERQARARAAEELREAAAGIRRDYQGECPTEIADEITGYADALTAEDPAVRL
jgi:hypothetical protein